MSIMIFPVWCAAFSSALLVMYGLDYSPLGEHMDAAKMVKLYRESGGQALPAVEIFARWHDLRRIDRVNG